MAANGISTLPTKEMRQKAKLDLAAANRAADGNPRATYDISQLPTQYNGNVILDNISDGNVLTPGRPWITTVSFTVYEAFGSNVAISTTQYTSGNKIYVYASTFDVPSYGNAVIKVNDIEIYNAGSRGHTVAVLDSYGDTISINTYDTYGGPANVTALTSAVNSVSSGSIVVLTVWDASALDATARSAINTAFGSTNTNTWTASRISHIFIGEKV